MRDDIDLRLSAWLEAGPDRASEAFVTATLAPIPYMRRRPALHARLGRLLGDRWGAAPRRAMRLAALVAILVVIATAIAVGGGGFGTPAPSPSPAPTPTVTFSLTTLGGPTGPFHEVRQPGLATCLTEDGGPWRLNYAGGAEPFVTLDVFVGDGAATEPGSNRVAAEIQLSSPDLYVRFDPAILRGGDGVGRSSASITVTSDATAASMTISAITPNRTTGLDGPPVTVDLNIVCRR